MKCRYVKDVFLNKENGYCVANYHTEDESVPQAARSNYYKGDGIQFSAVGYNLPRSATVDVDLCGKWAKGKYGMQLQVEQFEEILPKTLEGIEGYLASGMIKGIGPRTAELIADRFGTKTFKVLDEEPERLLEIKGITEKKLKTILFSYQESHAVRDLAAYLTPYKVSSHKIHKIYEEFGASSLEITKKSPFSLCRISGFGFLTVDEIAKANACRPNDIMRIEGCIQYCMEQIQQEGHLFAQKDKFAQMLHRHLNQGYDREVVTLGEINNSLYQAVQSGILVLEEGVLYPAFNYRNEVITAELIAQKLLEEENQNVQYEFLIAEAQKELGILLSGKQAAGVKMVFTHRLSIITGGPGTGKTTVQKILMYVYEKSGGKKAILMAPTGRASRRMAESTGIDEACTMHSGLGILGEGTDYELEVAELDADFLILDEQSMVDMHLASVFFQHVKKGSRIVLIGDVDQLPSVGPGNVFRELIQSGVVPVTVLDMVFRQGENSRIPLNAHRMQEAKADLDYGTDFVFLPAGSDTEAAEKIKEIYLKNVAEVGVENVQILSPYRKRGAASSNYLNEMLREVVNPDKPGMVRFAAAGKVFRVGDKIIQNKNKDEISNGDIGFVREIHVDEDGIETVKLEFGNGRIVEYGQEEMEMIEHSYATTVHKSQGSEYPVVILPWIPMFYKMLKRNILYTAITRAKVRVYIVGSKQSIYKAIHNPEADKRNTRLGTRVISNYRKLLDKQKGSEEEYVQLAMNF